MVHKFSVFYKPLNMTVKSERQAAGRTGTALLPAKPGQAQKPANESLLSFAGFCARFCRAAAKFRAAPSARQLVFLLARQLPDGIMSKYYKQSALPDQNRPPPYISLNYNKRPFRHILSMSPISISRPKFPLLHNRSSAIIHIHNPAKFLSIAQAGPRKFYDPRPSEAHLLPSAYMPALLLYSLDITASAFMLSCIKTFPLSLDLLVQL